MNDEIPEALLKKNPLLPSIMAAIDAFKAGKEVTQKDPQTGEVFVVEDDPQLGVLTVRAGSKILYRSKRKTK